MPFVASKYFEPNNKTDSKEQKEKLRTKYHHDPELEKEFRRQYEILKKLKIPLEQYLEFLADIFSLDEGQKSLSGRHYTGGLYESLPSEAGRLSDKLTKLFRCKEVIRDLATTPDGANLLKSNQLDDLEKRQNIISFLNVSDHFHAKDLLKYLDNLTREPEVTSSKNSTSNSDDRSRTSSGNSHMSIISELEEEQEKQKPPQLQLDNAATQHKISKNKHCIIM